MRLLLSLFVACFLCIGATSDAATFLYFNSQSGDYIGQGVERTWTPEDGVFTVSANASRNVVSVSFDGDDWWYLDFAAPSGSILNAGAYENATRYPFQLPTLPGLDVSGDGRGCNELTGRFDVLEISYDAQGQIDSFSADFEQHCEGDSAALFGSIRYNASGFPLKVSILADGSHTPVTTKVGTAVTVSVKTEAGDDAGKIAEHWVGLVGPYGNKWYTGTKLVSSNTSPLKWFRGPIEDKTLSFVWKPASPGVYMFQVAVDTEINGKMKTQSVDHVVITVLGSPIGVRVLQP
jgi:hypothetical protein